MGSKQEGVFVLEEKGFRMLLLKSSSFWLPAGGNDQKARQAPAMNKAELSHLIHTHIEELGKQNTESRPNWGELARSIVVLKKNIFFVDSCWHINVDSLVSVMLNGLFGDSNVKDKSQPQKPCFWVSHNSSAFHILGIATLNLHLNFSCHFH